MTSFFLKKKVDTGDMILQQKVDIASTDTYDSLHERLAELAGPFTMRTLKLIETGESEPVAQDDTEACPAPKIRPEDAEIDFDQPSSKVADFIRGLATKPGAFTLFRGQKLKVYGAMSSEIDGEEPAASGTIVPHRKKLLVQCREGVVELTLVVPAARKEMDGGSFINGFRPQAGESFERN